MTTRTFAYTLLMLLLPSAAWAHTCGPRTLEVKKGNTVDYGITGRDFIEYQILVKGDPLVSTIEPPPKNDDYDVWFKIVGTGNGATTFKIRWDGSHRFGFCRVEVTVKQ